MIVSLLPWLLSAITIWMTVLAGNKHPSAWAIGLGNQALWLVWIVASESWGLLPMNVALWIVYGRNHLKWNDGQLLNKVRGALGAVRGRFTGKAGAPASTNDVAEVSFGDTEVSPPPPNKPIEVMVAPAPSILSDGAKTRKSVQWGTALKNIAGAFGKAIGFITRNPILVWVLVVFALYMMVVGFRSPFDLFGPSKAELRAELRIAQAEARALEAEAALANYAAKRAEQTQRAERRITEAVSRAEKEIEDAASTIDPDALYAAYAGAYRSLRDNNPDPRNAHPPAGGANRVRGAVGSPV